MRASAARGCVGHVCTKLGVSEQRTCRVLATPARRSAIASGRWTMKPFDRRDRSIGTGVWAVWVSPNHRTITCGGLVDESQAHRADQAMRRAETPGETMATGAALADGRPLCPSAPDAPEPCPGLRFRRGTHDGWLSNQTAHDHGRTHPGMFGHRGRAALMLK